MRREAYLAIEAGRSSLDADDSRGINNTVIFCSDLAVLAHRRGHGPEFLIHDSHLYDGVDERQVARALALAAEVTEQGHMQYIVTLNTDSLSTAAQRGFTPERHIRSPRLTDDETVRMRQRRQQRSRGAYFGCHGRAATHGVAVAELEPSRSGSAVGNDPQAEGSRAYSSLGGPTGPGRRVDDGGQFESPTYGQL
ncbi:DUF2326 domain-containing protein [Streptomyces asoensis]